MAINNTTSPKNAAPVSDSAFDLNNFLAATSVPKKLPLGNHEVIFTGYKPVGSIGVNLLLTATTTDGTTFTDFCPLQMLEAVTEGIEAQLTLNAPNMLYLLQAAQGQSLQVQVSQREDKNGTLQTNCEYRPSRFTTLAKPKLDEEV